MPARKPQSLHTRHATKAEKATRVANEEAMKPDRGLPMAAPARLKGHDAASEAWRRLMRLYGELESEIATRLDQELLINYCMLVEQLAEIDLMRKTTYKMWLEIGVKHDQALRKIIEAKEAAENSMSAATESGVEMPEKGMGSLAEVEKWEDRAIALASKALDAFDAVVKLDGRADRKRALLYTLSQGLYLTPRARAGTAPSKKEQEPEKDPLEMLLDDVSNYVNGAGDAK